MCLNLTSKIRRGEGGVGKDQWRKDYVYWQASRRAWDNTEIRLQLTDQSSVFVFSFLWQITAFSEVAVDLAPVIQKVVNAIHRINLCPVDNAIVSFLILTHWIEIYPLDNVIQLSNNWGLITVCVERIEQCTFINFRNSAKRSVCVGKML